jgi:hypothetical protein
VYLTLTSSGQSVEFCDIDTSEYPDTEDIQVAVWAHLFISNATTSLVAIGRMEDTHGGIVYANEFGSTGKSIPSPSSGTVFRTVFLGTFSLRTGGAPISKAFQPIISLTYGGTAPGVNALITAPADSVFSSQTGVVGSTVPALSAGEWIVGEDLSMERNVYGPRTRAGSMLGSSLTVPPGRARAMFAPVTYVVDRTDSNSSSGAFGTSSYANGFHVAVQPRVRMIGS